MDRQLICFTLFRMEPILFGIKYPAVYTEYRLQAITPYYSTAPTFTAGVAGTFPSSVSVVVSLTSVSCLIPLL